MTIADAAQRLLTIHDATLRAVDRAAREECARIAEEVSREASYDAAKIAAQLVAVRIRKTIKG